ncbi:MAG: serine hydrolase [Candidatus Aminicenantes bacterium]|nr:serine hydrolase [Candidatus Aminicenantes bacterium]
MNKKTAFLFSFLFLTLMSQPGLQSQDKISAPYSDAIKKYEAFVSEHMALDRVPGLTVGFLKDGHVWVQGFGYADLENKVPAMPESSYRLASVSKTITALAVLKLVEMGKIDLDAEVQKYVPYFPKKTWPVTIRKLLGHLGGISHYRDYNMEGHIKVHKNTREALAIFQDFELVAEPGTLYHYSSYGFNLLGAAVEGASGQPYGVFIKENIFDPLGMTGSRLDDPVDIIPHRVRGYRLLNGRIKNSEYVDVSSRFGGGGLRSSVVDLLKYAIGILDKKLLHEETWRQMFTPMVLRNGHFTHYGMGWDTRDWNGHFQVSHGGAQPETRTHLLIFPVERFAIAIASNFESCDRTPYVERLAELILDEDMDLKFYAPDKDSQTLLTTIRNIFSRGLSMYLWNKKSIAAEEEDLADAFSYFHQNVNKGSLSAQYKKTRKKIEEGFQPATDQALVKVGSFMASELADAMGEDALKTYHKRGPLAFFADYITTGKSRPGSKSGYKFGKNISEMIAHWAAQWGRVYTEETKNPFLSPEEDVIDQGRRLKERFSGMEIYPDYAESINRVSQYFLKRGEYDKAFATLSLAMDLYPGRPGPLCGLAAAHIWTGDPESALRLYRRAIALDAEPSGSMLNLLYTLAQQLNEEGHFDKIFTVFSVAEALFPKNAKLMTDIGDAFLETGDRKKAIAYYEKALKIAPGFKLAKEKLERAKGR